jgi:hypothetical protein
MTRPALVIAAALLLTASSRASGQEVFHSVQSANLPTAEILPRGAWLFEISHRFLPPVSDGASALWGLDGPVRNRFGLSYSVSDRVALGVLRTNFEDNLELSAKVGLLQAGSEGLPVKVAAMGGVAWNTEVFEDPSHGGEDNEMQLYAQLVVNALVGERVALGVVPTYLRNPRILDFDTDNAFVLGLNGQWYASPSMSLLAEWIVSEQRPGLTHDSGTFGVELETRGHVFKLVFTNQVAMNPTQVLGGTPVDFEPDEWRFGFNLTRLLPF